MYKRQNYSDFQNININVIDFILGILLLYGLISGIVKGIISEFTSLISIGLSILLAKNLKNLVSSFIINFVDIDYIYVDVLSFVIVFFLGRWLLKLFMKLFNNLVNGSFLSVINRLLGGIFGVLKITVICSTLIMFIAPINNRLGLVSKRKINESKLYEPIFRIGQQVIPEFSKIRRPNHLFFKQLFNS